MAEMMEIEWREPGPSRRGFSRGQAGKWEPLLRPMMHHPMRWAVIAKKEDAQKASGLAASLRSPKAKIPAGKWEFTSRDGEVFARYIGPE